MQGRRSQGARKDGCTGVEGQLHAELPGERARGYARTKVCGMVKAISVLAA